MADARRADKVERDDQSTSPGTRVSDPHFTPVDDVTSEVYCRIVNDIATVTLRSRHGTITASTANLLWEAITASRQRRGLCWRMCQHIIHRLLDDFQATGGPRQSRVLAAYVRLKEFAEGDAPRSVDGVELCCSNVAQLPMRPVRPGSRFVRRKQKKRSSVENPEPSVIDGEGFFVADKRTFA